MVRALLPWFESSAGFPIPSNMHCTRHRASYLTLYVQCSRVKVGRNERKYHTIGDINVRSCPDNPEWYHQGAIFIYPYHFALARLVRPRADRDRTALSYNTVRELLVHCSCFFLRLCSQLIRDRGLKSSLWIEERECGLTDGRDGGSL